MLKAVRIMLIVILNIVIYGIVIFAGFEICEKSYDFSYDTLGATMADVAPGKDEVFAIERGETPSRICEKLEDRGLIKNQYSFRARLMIEGKLDKLKPGVFDLNSSMTYEEIEDILCGAHN